MARPAGAELRRARILRGVWVCIIVMAAAVVAAFFNVAAAFAVIVFALPVMAFATMPKLVPGQYDLFAIGAVVIALVIGIAALAMEPTHRPFFSKYDDPCADGGCGDRSY